MRPGTALCILIAAAAAATGRAQVVLHPNQFVGDVRFTNTNPEIVAVLSSRWSEAAISAWATDGSGVSAFTTVPCAPADRPCPYELSAESADTGRPFVLSAKIQSFGSYYTTWPIATPDLFPEPAPDASFDVAECAGMVRVRWVDASGNPARPRRASASVERSHPLGGEISAYVPVSGSDVLDLPCAADGTSWLLKIYYEFGSDPFHDTIKMDDWRQVVPECDVVTEIVIDASRCLGDPDLLPRIVGVADVLGESERDLGSEMYGSTLVTGSGPFGNSRLDRLHGDPCSGPFELENLVPSTWRAPPQPWKLSAIISLRSGLSFVRVVMRWPDVLVPDSGTVDVGNALVMDPGEVSGSVRFVGPLPDIAPNPVLSDLIVSDEDRSLGTSITGTVVNPSFPAGYLEKSVACGGTLDGGFDVAAGTYEGLYAHPAGGLDATADWWAVRSMQLKVEDDGDPATPTTHRDLIVDLTDANPDIVWASPGSAHRIDHAFCFSDVYVDYESPTPLYGPFVTNNYGSHRGRDFEGMPRDYDVRIQRAGGTPLDLASAANRGLLVMTMPEGSYEIRPGATIVNPGGGTSLVYLPLIPLEVGCRQVIWMTGDLAVSLDSIADCTGDVLPTLTASVASTRPVSLVAHSIDGASEIVSCTDCGISPTVLIPVDVALGDARVDVRAVDDQGRQATTTVFTTRLREVSPLDLRPDATPLRVTKAPGESLELTWEILAGPVQHAVSIGTIASLQDAMTYDHLPVSCGVTMPRFQTGPVEGDRYFLVTEGCKFSVGPSGRDSFGRERPQRASGCR